MVKTIRHIGFLFVLFISLFLNKADAQNIDAFARVSVSPREGVVRQPYNVTISVYSSTWFAQPLQFANLQIENAFIIPFTRTVSGINYINKKKYATLTFYYLVFPYETGDMMIPELEINTSIPPENDYKGQPVTIKTKPQKIHVGAVPSSKDEDVWMVAKNVTVRESWSKDLKNLKVGDVVERKITISVEGTLPSLILPMEITEPENVSVYPAQANLQDKRNDRDVNGIRSETYSYLLEKEGEVIIPEEKITWWDPITKRVYQRTLQEQKLNIAPNPDLTMMASLKDSLLAMNASGLNEEKQKSTPWLYLFLILPTLLIIYFTLRLIRRLIGYTKARKTAYLESEVWYFKQVQLALKKQDKPAFINALYRWFDHTRSSEDNPSISFYLTAEQKCDLESYLKNIKDKSGKIIFDIAMLRSIRKNIISQNKIQKERGINPNPL